MKEINYILKCQLFKSSWYMLAYAIDTEDSGTTKSISLCFHLMYVGIQNETGNQTRQ